MSGLVLKLAPGERFVVNGALLENGDKPSSIKVRDGHARVLRVRDALKPEDVTTPVKQVYFAIQLLITGDMTEEAVLPAILRECNALADVFAPIDPNWIPTLRSMVMRENYYSALCHLRHLIAVEAELIEYGKVQEAQVA